MQPSLNDIAKATGVSRATVSRALNNSPLISEATSTRVRQAAEKLGYKGDPVASNMMRSFRNRGGLESGTVIGWINEYEDPRHWKKVAFKKHFYEGAETQARSLGIRVEPICLKEPGMSGKRVRAILLSRGIRGLIFPTPRHPISEYGIDWDEFALTILGGRPDTHEFTQVIPDHYDNFELLLDKLTELGYERVGLILNEFLDWETERKVRSRFLLHTALSRPKNRIPILFENEKHPLDKELIQWVKRYQPECIIAYRAETVKWLEDAGYRVPDDISIVSNNVTEHTVNWAGIRTNQRQMGAVALNSVIGNLNRFQYGSSHQNVKSVVTGRWQQGTTLGKVSG